MELTQTLIDEVVIAAREVDHGNIIIAISGPPNKKVVDIITEKRKRYRENITPKGSDYQYESAQNSA